MVVGSRCVVVSYRHCPSISTVAVHSNAEAGVVGEGAVADNHLGTVGYVKHPARTKVSRNEIYISSTSVHN